MTREQRLLIVSHRGCRSGRQQLCRPLKQSSIKLLSIPALADCNGTEPPAQVDCDRLSAFSAVGKVCCRQLHLPISEVNRVLGTRRT